MMSACEHKFKKRVYGPFSQAGIQFKLVCSDCLTLLNTSLGESQPRPKNKLVITDDNRMEIRALLHRLSDGGLQQRFNDFEKTFVNDFIERSRKFDDLRVSEKQQEILDRLQAKYVGDPQGELESRAPVSVASVPSTTEKEPFDFDADIPF